LVTVNNRSVPYGELDSEDKLWQRASLRQEFLNAIAQHSVEVFQDLVKIVLPAFLKLGDFERMLTWKEICAESSTKAKAKLVFEGMNAWAERWNLSWCREECYNELMMDYHRETNRDREPAPFDDTILDSLFASERWELSAPASPEGFRNYRPTNETRATYLRYVESHSLKAFTDDPRLKNVEASQRAASVASIVKRAETYCAKLEQCYLNSDYTRTEKRRNLDQHLEWLVRISIKRQTLTEVAETKSVEVAAVSKAIYHLLQQMDLPKPPHLKKGRIQGSKNKKYHG
jgi:hypothetical protein